MSKSEKFFTGVFFILLLVVTPVLEALPDGIIHSHEVRK